MWRACRIWDCWLVGFGVSRLGFAVQGLARTNRLRVCVYEDLRSSQRFYKCHVGRVQGRSIIQSAARGRRFQMVDQECAFGAQGHKIWVCRLEVTWALGSRDVCLGLQGEFLKIILPESLTGTMISV